MGGCDGLMGVTGSPRVMQELVVVRHAQTEPGSPGMADAKRALTQVGKEQAAALGQWLAEEGARLDRVVASPAVRARETARLILESVGPKWEAVRWVDEVYGAGGRRLWEILQEMGEGAKGVLLVGHYPGVQDLVTRLVGREGPKKRFEPGGCAWLQAEGTGEPGQWRLEHSR